MAQAAFKFQKGPIFLSDDKVQADSVQADSVHAKHLSRFDVFTTYLHFLSIYISNVGVASLAWAYVVIQRSYDHGGAAFYNDFVENFMAVVVLLSGSVIWSFLNLWLLQKRRTVPPHSLTFIYNTSVTFGLVYFPAVCCCRIYDMWSDMACEYLPNPDESCLPVYSRILETEVVGLACAIFVALIHLLHITARVIVVIVDMKNDGKTSLLGVWLNLDGHVRLE